MEMPALFLSSFVPFIGEKLPLACSNVLPKNGIPVTKWFDRDEVFEEITKGILEVVRKLLLQSSSSVDERESKEIESSGSVVVGMYQKKDNQLHFPSQEPDESVRMVVRRHWITLIKPAIPLIGALVLFALVTGLTILRLANIPIWSFLNIIFGILVIAAAMYFVGKGVILWWADVDIITNKRLLTRRGFVRPIQHEMPLNKIMQVGVDQETPLSILFSYGTLYLYIVGGVIVMRDIPYPQKIKDVIIGFSQKTEPKKPSE